MEEGDLKGIEENMEKQRKKIQRSVRSCEAKERKKNERGGKRM